MAWMAVHYSDALKRQWSHGHVLRVACSCTLHCSPFDATELQSTELHRTGSKQDQLGEANTKLLTGSRGLTRKHNSATKTTCMYIVDKQQCKTERGQPRQHKSAHSAQRPTIQLHVWYKARMAQKQVHMRTVLIGHGSCTQSSYVMVPTLRVTSLWKRCSRALIISLLVLLVRRLPSLLSVHLAREGVIDLSHVDPGLHTHARAHTHTHTHTHMHTRAYVHIHMAAHTHTHTHTRAHMAAHTHMQRMMHMPTVQRCMTCIYVIGLMCQTWQ